MHRKREDKLLSVMVLLASAIVMAELFGALFGVSVLPGDPPLLLLSGKILLAVAALVFTGVALTLLDFW